MVPLVQEVVLQHHTQPGAVRLQSHGGEVAAVHPDPAPVRLQEGGRQAGQGGLSRSGTPHQRRHASGGSFEAHPLQHRVSRLVGEGHVFEDDMALHVVQGHGPARIVVFPGRRQDLLAPVEAGERLGHLAPDVAHLDDGRNEESQEEGEGDEVTHRHLTLQDHGAPQSHDPHAGQAQEQGRRAGDQAGGGEGLPDVVEDPRHPLFEDADLLPLGAEPLDHPDTPQRFGEPAGDVGVDLAPLAEDGADVAEGLQRDQSQDGEGNQGVDRHQDADPEEEKEGADGGQDSAEKMDESRADQVPDTLHVGHDPGDQLPRLGVVEEPDGQIDDVALDLRPEQGNQVLSLHAQEPGQKIGAEGLNRDGRRHAGQQQPEQLGVPLADDVVHEKLAGRRQRESGDTVQQDQDQAQQEQPAPRPDDLLERVPDGGERRLLPALS